MRPAADESARGQITPVRAEGEDALITLDLPAGDHVVTIRFTNTPLRTLAAAISLATAALLLALIIRRPRTSAQP